MMFTASELGMCNFVLRATEKIGQGGLPEARHLSLDEMGAGISINKKLKALTRDDRFFDGEADFSTEEKVLLLKWIERSWPVEEAETYVELKRKLG